MACCDLHKDIGCCDSNDCGPCCENCPTCPTLKLHDLKRIVENKGFEVVAGSFRLPDGSFSRFHIRPKDPRKMIEHAILAFEDRERERAGG